jgi:hypothetical protein
VNTSDNKPRPSVEKVIHLGLMTQYHDKDRVLERVDAAFAQASALVPVDRHQALVDAYDMVVAIVERAALIAGQAVVETQQWKQEYRQLAEEKTRLEAELGDPFWSSDSRIEALVDVITDSVVESYTEETEARIAQLQDELTQARDERRQEVWEEAYEAGYEQGRDDKPE